MRIDSAKNQVRDAVTLLERVWLELEDLHVLGYERSKAAEENVRVSGGGRDYALDTHGDPRVRDAYRLFSDVVHQAAGEVTDAALNVLKRLSAGPSPAARTPRTIQAAEHALAIAAAGRRLERGEYQPHRNEHQAGIDTALQAAMEANMRLDRENARLVKELDRVRRERDRLRDRPSKTSRDQVAFQARSQ